ncbi:hypothetical protein QAD02_022595 [Eretmocerus hayati]|uniref:Uncharacterized protein n=1 Tax=Eretmocerus hayati TaxID=131215 RepID=A0ACC2PVI4_9HYME|nr:hypothetical protein QAD02_022595 [Eretmocerus hayati]
MPKLTRCEALEIISSWNTTDVVALLQKNAVDEACWKAVEKRQIDGDELLHLTEGKLALWKSDLTRPLIWSLWTFVEELKKSPEKHVEEKLSQKSQSLSENQQEQNKTPVRSEELHHLTTTRSETVVPNSSTFLSQMLQAAQRSTDNSESLSDTGWDTDFEDSVDDPADECNAQETSTMASQINHNFRNSLRLFQENDRAKLENDMRASSCSLEREDKKYDEVAPDSFTYANCDSTVSNDNQAQNNNQEVEQESTYANVGSSDEHQNLTLASTIKISEPRRNASRLHHQVDKNDANSGNKSLAEKLREQLLLLNGNGTTSKPQPAPKPDSLQQHRVVKNIVSNGTNNGAQNGANSNGNNIKVEDQQVQLRRSAEPRKSFLHKGAAAAQARRNALEATTATANNRPKSSSGGSSTTEQQSSSNMRRQSSSEESLMRNLPKPPVTIRGFDLVANLPPNCHGTTPDDESEDDEVVTDDQSMEQGYEAFDEQIVEQHQRMMRADSGQSIVSSLRQNSLESVYRPASSSLEDEVYEIYESITESPEENGLKFKSDGDLNSVVRPPPLPAKPPPNITTLHNLANKPDAKTERSSEKKSATLPHAVSNTSLNNAARPLPPPPDKQSYYDRPWFHNLTREQANLLIEEQCTYGNSHDGYFLMRPSTSNPNNPLTLVLWCKDRVYNVPVRRRPDNRYALGTSKPEEQSFASIDEIIPFYKKEKLVLYTGGVQTGSTKLSETPPKTL